MIKGQAGGDANTNPTTKFGSFLTNSMATANKAPWAITITGFCTIVFKKYVSCSAQSFGV